MNRASFTVLVIAGCALALISATVQISGNPTLWGLLPSEPIAMLWVIPGTLACLGILLLTLLGREKILIEHEYKLPRFSGKPLIIVAGLGLMLAAWYLRSRNHFMGDGWAYLEMVKQDFFLREHEPLDFFLHQLIFRALAAIGIRDSGYVYSLPHLALLPVYLLVLWKISCLLAVQRLSRISSFLFLCATGALQLFFGYVESYTLLNLMLALYYYVSLKHIGRSPDRIPWLPGAILALAMALHLSAAALTPTLLYMLLLRFNSGRDEKITGQNAVIVLIPFAVACVTAIAVFQGSLLLPLFAKGDKAYTLLSIGNILDKVNYITLVLPSAAIIALLLLLRGSVFFGQKSPRTVFLILGVLSVGTLVLIFDPLLGIRDWDIMTISALPLAMLGVTAFLFLLDYPRHVALLSGLALLSMIHVSTLIWTNATEYRGVRFLSRVLEQEQHRGTNLTQLGVLLYEHGYYLAAGKAYRRVKGMSRVRADFNISKLNIVLGRPAQAIRLLQPYVGLPLAKGPRAVLMNYLVVAHDLAGEPEKATDYFLNVLAEELFPTPSMKKDWIVQNTNANLRNRYWLEYRQDPPPAGVLMFFFRSYSLAFDAQKILEVYRKIVSNEFTADQWTTFIQLAKLSEHEQYTILIERACKQHPQLAAQFLRLRKPSPD